MKESVSLCLQRASRERYKTHAEPAPDIPAPVEKLEPERQPTPEERQYEKETAARALAIMKEAGIEFVNASDYTTKKKRITPPKPVKEVTPPKKEVVVNSMFDTPQKPEVDFRKINKHAGRAIFDPRDRIHVQTPLEKAVEEFKKDYQRKKNKKESNADVEKTNDFAGKKHIPSTYISEEAPKKIVRPPAVYSNKKSLYGIDYNDL